MPGSTPWSSKPPWPTPRCPARVVALSFQLVFSTSSLMPLCTILPSVSSGCFGVVWVVMQSLAPTQVPVVVSFGVATFFSVFSHASDVDRHGVRDHLACRSPAAISGTDHVIRWLAASYVGRARAGSRRKAGSTLPSRPDMSSVHRHPGDPGVGDVGDRQRVGDRRLRLHDAVTGHAGLGQRPLGRVVDRAALAVCGGDHVGRAVVRARAPGQVRDRHARGLLDVRDVEGERHGLRARQACRRPRSAGCPPRSRGPGRRRLTYVACFSSSVRSSCTVTLVGSMPDTLVAESV